LYVDFNAEQRKKRRSLEADITFLNEQKLGLTNQLEKIKWYKQIVDKIRTFHGTDGTSHFLIAFNSLGEQAEFVLLSKTEHEKRNNNLQDLASKYEELLARKKDQPRVQVENSTEHYKAAQEMSKIYQDEAERLRHKISLLEKQHAAAVQNLQQVYLAKDERLSAKLAAQTEEIKQSEYEHSVQVN
jgi:hypothetical protein